MTAVALIRTHPARRVDAFTSPGFRARIDDKGRVTVPAEFRERLGLESGEEVSLRVESASTLRKNFSSLQEALSFLEDLEDVQSFSYESGVLEVVIR